MFITAILRIVYYKRNKKSPRAHSLNYAGNEYDFEYDFFKLMKNDENDILAICAILQRLKTYSVMMETVFEILTKMIFISDKIIPGRGHKSLSK